MTFVSSLTPPLCLQICHILQERKIHIVQYPQKVLTGLPMPLTSIVDVVGLIYFTGSYVHVNVVYQISASWVKNCGVSVNLK